jgi:O-antigen/teichoic acid export membrane protein
VTLVAAFIAVPLLVHSLGVQRFGVLALAWVVIGYAQVFDLGIGRALVKLTSEQIGAGRERDNPRFFWTALGGMLLLGCAAGGVVAALSPWLVGSALNVPAQLERETLHAFWLLSASLPLAISGAALRAHLEAWQRFDLVNAVVVPAALITYFGPVLALQLENSLVLVVAAVILSRVFSWSLTFAMVLRITPALRSGQRFARAALRRLLGVGTWVTAANVTNALMQAADRFLVGVFASLAAVTFFATPYEVVTKLWLVAFTVAGVFFPAFALTLTADPRRTRTIFGGAMRLGFIALFPVVLGIVVFAREGLDLWLGPEFAVNSERVLQWLAAGVLISSLGQIPFGLVQSARPDLTGKLALIELPLYLGAFIALLQAGGIEAAAAAWAGRAAIEMIVLLAMAERVAPGSLRALDRMGPVAVAAAAALAVGSQLTAEHAKLAFLLASLLAFAPLAWLWVLRDTERTRIRARLRRGGAAAPELTVDG